MRSNGKQSEALRKKTDDVHVLGFVYLAEWHDKKAKLKLTVRREKVSSQ